MTFQVGEAISSVLDGFLIGTGDVTYTAVTTVMISGIGIIGILFFFNAGLANVAILWGFIKLGNVGRLLFSVPRIFFSSKSPLKSSAA